MIKVTTVIQKILKQKEAELATGEESMLRLLTNLHGQVMADLGKAALGSWDAYQLKQYLDAIERRIADYDSEAKTELGKHIQKTWDLGQQSVYKPLEAGGIYSGFNLSSSVLKTLEDFAFHKIGGVSNAAWDKIRGELTLGSLGAKTPQQVAEAIGPNLKDPGIFKSIAERQEVIVKTELGRVNSTAAELRRQDAARYVSGVEKIWKHGHPKIPRLGHLGIDGQKRPVNKPFNLVDRKGNQITMMHPHDPNAPIGETIKCQCDAVTWNSAWGEYKAA